MNKKLIGRIARKHYFLNMINPKDELLKYFTLDEEGYFRMCGETDFEEYVDRFRGDLMSLDNFVEEFTKEHMTGKITLDFEEYHKELFLVTAKNYLSALEDEIWKIEKGN